MKTNSWAIIPIILIFGLRNGFGDEISDKVRAYMDSIDRTWLDEEPNTSGFANCRVCTREYKKLSPPEQKFWKDVVSLNLNPDETLKLMKKLSDLVLFQDLAIESENLESHSRFTGDDKSGQKKHTKYLNGQVDKLLNEIPHSAHELLEFYLTENQLSSEEVNEKINDIYYKLNTVPAWQAYEAEIPKVTFEESHVKVSKPFEVNSNFTDNGTKSHEKDEL